MDEMSAFFRRSEHGFEPLPLASSGWSTNMISGPAICAVLAATLDREYGAEGFIPARLTVDMFSPAQFEPLTVATTEVRRGKRIRVADATVIQSGKPVARASAVFLKASEQPPGERWVRDKQPVPPPAQLVAATEPENAPLYYSDRQGRWSDTPAEHQSATRKRSWQRPFPAVLGEQPSPFVLAAVAAETTSMMTNWGSEGVSFINADLTLALARLPIGSQIGLETDNHIAEDGVAIGTATLFDRRGSFGTGMVVSLANAARTIDFSGDSFVPPALRERYEQILAPRKE